MTVQPARTAKAKPRSRLRLWIRGLVGLAMLATIGVFHRPLFLGNLATVDSGRVYRSAQPKRNLSHILDEYKPAAILNLRGGSPADDWYSAEVEQCSQRGIDFYDYPMSAESQPSRRELLTLIDFFDRTKYPLLIHCKKGADRTGLACALYQMSVQKVSPEQAMRCFAITHGHVPLFGPELLHRPLDEYREWLSSNQLEHSPARFRDWVARIYRDPAGVEPGFAIDHLKPGSRWVLNEATARKTATRASR
jgi:protein tyrosine phosphatase (PTP) superfamily phosphohydrolase (DUF442 family)